jgi:archaellum component FlaC
MAALGSLVVSLTAQTAQFTSAMDRAAYQSQKNFTSITNAAKMAGAAIGIALSGTAFVRSIKSQIDLADEVAKTSQKIGVQAEELQKLRYAADLSGVSSETLTKALSRISSEAINGNEGLKKLGIAVRDTNGRLKSSDQILIDVADKVSKYSDGVGKTALVTKIFGERIARDLIPFLNSGAKGIEDLKKEAEELGFVMSQETVEAAERFNDNLTRLGRASDSLFSKIAQELLPALEDITEAFIQIAKEGTLVQLVSKSMLVVFQTLAVIGSDLGFVFVQIAKGLEMVATVAGNVATGEFAAAKQAFVDYNNQAEESRKKLDQFQKTIMGLGEATLKSGRDFGKSKDDAEGFSDATDKVGDAIDRLRKEYIGLFLTKQEMAILDLQMMGATPQQIADATRLAEVIRIETEAREEAKEKMKEYQDLLGRFNTLYNETASPAQKLADKEAELLSLRNELIAAGYDLAFVENLIAEARMNAADSFMPPKKEVEQTKTLVEDLSKAIGTAFEDALVSGGNFRELLKGIEQDILRIITRRLVTNPLEKFITNLDFSSIFGGAKFAGGPVSSGKAYIVGEQGPEIFMPPVAGNIVPNGQTAGMVSNGSVSISNTFYLSAPADKRTQQQVAAMAGMGVQRAIARNT